MEEELFSKFVVPIDRRFGSPIYFVNDAQNGMIEIQKTFYFPKRKYGDFEWVDPSKFTTFKVKYGDMDDLGEVVDAEGDPDDEYYFVDFGNGAKRYSIFDLEIVRDSDPLNYELTKRGIEEMAKMKEVSREGVVKHLPISENIQKTVYSMLTGVPGRVPESKANVFLKEKISRPRGAPGAGPPEQRPYRRSIYNQALNTGPLPYGPSEENFAGGSRRNSRVRIGTQMARRGSTRRSRGLFSRLYSPVGHLLSAGKESVGAVTNTAKGVVGQGVGGLDKIGRSVTKHANQAVKDVFSRKGGKRRGTRKSRKTRKARHSRKH